MLIHYIEFLLKDGTSRVEKIDKRKIKFSDIPSDAIAYRFFDRVEVDVEETIYRGKPKNYSEYIYL